MNALSEKELLRKRFRERRGLLSLAEVESLSRIICDHAMALPSYHAAPIVGLYLAVDHEVDPALLMADAHRRGKTVLLPAVSRSERRMTLRPHEPGAPLVRGPFGISEPVDAGRIAPPPNLLFLPLVGFDRRGTRLGYGGGYYDRWLGERIDAPDPLSLVDSKNGGAAEDGRTPSRPLLLGLAYAFQQAERLPREPHDHPLDGVVTEHGVLWSRRD